MPSFFRFDSRLASGRSSRPESKFTKLALALALLAVASIRVGDATPAGPSDEEISRFWQATKARLVSQATNAVVERIPHSEEALPYHKLRLTLTSLDGVKVRAYLSYPILGEITANAWELDHAAAKLPAIVSAPGYGGFEQSTQLEECQRGYIILQIFPRSQGPSAELWKIKDREKLSWGIEKPEGYYYQGAYADVIRAVDYLISRPDVDVERIGAVGSCQAGGIMLAVGSLDPRIKAIAAHVPNLIDMRHAIHVEGSLVNRLKQTPVFRSEHLDTLDYFDALRLVPNLRAAVLVSAGGKDKVSPAASIRPVFDRIAGIKCLMYYPELTHTTATGFYEMTWSWMDQHLRRHTRK